MKKNGFWKGFGSGLILTVLIVALGVMATATSRRKRNSAARLGRAIRPFMASPSRSTSPKGRQQPKAAATAAARA